MNKNSPLYYHDEIDLVDLCKTIWNNKFKVLVITIITFLIAFGYSSKVPNSYSNSLSISLVDNYKFKMYDNILKLIKSNHTATTDKTIEQPEITNLIILDKFFNELKDYDEFLSSLKKTKKIQGDVSELTIEYQEIKLFDYAKLLTITVPKKKDEDYTVNLKWHDPDEAKKILKDTLDLALDNMTIDIYEELKQLLDYEKKLIINKDIERLNFLKEQSKIAEELNMIENQMNIVNSKISLIDSAYYLRGYKAINKEIELIQGRVYPNLKFVEQEINKFKSLDTKLVDYNVYLVESKSLKKTKIILITSIILGLMVGIFYVLILNAFKSQTTFKKNK